MKRRCNTNMKIRKLYIEDSSVISSNFKLTKTKLTGPCNCEWYDIDTIPMVNSRWTFVDYLGAIRCRLSAFRNRYSIKPGLYRIGNPNSDSDVFVSANYKLSFNILRHSLAGMNAWILVLDTQGINVWCAAGKGTFGTENLVRSIKRYNLEKIVTHRKIIVPQLAAPGIDANAVAKLSGFRVIYGPVRAYDIPLFIQRGYHATPDMRKVTFTIIERMILIPMELIPALKKALPYLITLLMLGGMTSEGIIFSKTLEIGLPLVVVLLAALVSGAAITPLLLPLIPGRSFAVKGFVQGLMVAVITMFVFSYYHYKDVFFKMFSFISVPTLSSYLALQFTGATPITGQSGVEKEIKYAVPIYGINLLIAVAMLVIYLCKNWGIV